MDILETDLDYITRLVERTSTYSDLGSAIHAANQSVAVISRDIAIICGPDFISNALRGGLEAYELHHERYEEYHKIFKDLTTIEGL